VPKAFFSTGSELDLAGSLSFQRKFDGPKTDGFMGERDWRYLVDMGMSENGVYPQL